MKQFEKSSAGPMLTDAQRELMAQLLAEEGIELQGTGRITRRGAAEAPLSFAQQRLWLLEQMSPGDAAYNLPAAMQLSGPLDVAALHKALDEIVRRHEVLRTTFASADGEPFQVVHEHAALPLPLLDLSTVDDEAERQRQADLYMTEEARRPFDLARDPLLRASLLHLSQNSHRLLLTLHHIASDGWSMGVLLRELSALYTAYASGSHATPLADLPVQYGDYAAWQRGREGVDATDEGLRYWRERLAGVPALTELQIARPRPASQSGRGEVQSLTFEPGALEALKALSRQHGATLSMTLLAAFKVLLWRYSGQEDVVVGTPVANRYPTEVEPLIGFFVNTLVIRCDLGGDPTFGELLSRVRETCLSAYEHQDVPFERLVEELQPERSPNHSPLFQVMFNMQTLGDELSLSGIKVTPLELFTGLTKFDLSLSLVESKGRLVAWLQYKTDLFDAASVARMLAHYRTLVDAAAADPQKRLSELPLMTADERRHLRGWNETRADYHIERGLGELFEEQAERTPEAVAVAQDGERLSYRELNRRANQLAHRLRASGVGPEASVGIFLERSVEMMVGVLGVLKAGGCYVPLDPSLPEERLSYLLRDSRAVMLLTREALAGNLPEGAPPALRLDADWPAVAGGPDENPPPRATLQNAAYVIYTSGTTGRPKGVVVEQRQILNYLSAVRERIGFEPGLRFAMVQPLAVDSSQTVLFASLHTGGELHMVSQECAADGDALGDYFERHQIDFLKIAPSHLAALMTGTNPGRVLPRRYLVLGGESSRRQWAEALRPLAPDCSVFNHYGPTETTVGVTTYRIREGEPTPDAEIIPLGRPLGNVRAYVLDGRMRPVPVGLQGELHIGGDAVTRGYLGDPSRTAEKFVPDPFGDEPGMRLYKTGDVVRHLPGGDLLFLGRTDHQFKISGYRVEPGEVEAALLGHANVREALVSAREDGRGDKRLVAYVVAAGATQTPAGDLRSYLRERLPEYMVPQDFVWLERMPLTPHGKVDRLALPAPARPSRDASLEYAAPRTPVEELITEVFSQVLGVERVGAGDNFFGLGGHSLLATKAVSRLRNVFRCEIPLRLLFEAPSAAALAPRIESARRDTPSELPPPVGPRPLDAETPLSFAQQRLWLLHQFEPEASTYHVPKIFHLHGPLDADALARALTEIVRRHEVLRTCYPAHDGMPVQSVSPPEPLPLPFTDLSHLTAEQAEAEARRLAEREARRGFDLSTGPLVRATLLRVEEGRHILLLVLHHIASDGWSMGVLLRELSALYSAYAAGSQDSPLAELPVQYGDYAAWQRGQFEGGALGEGLRYWRERLQGAPALTELQIAKPRPASQSFHADFVTMRLDTELSAELRRLSREQGCTMFMLLLAAFKVLLWRYSGQEDVVVGTPVAYRTLREVEELIGCFINTLVLRTQLSEGMSFRELLKHVREVCLEAYEHQDVPFERLVEELQPERSPNHSPLFQVMVMRRGMEEVEWQEVGELKVRVGEVAAERAKFDLSLVVGERDGGIDCGLQFARELFEREAVERLMRHYGVLLEQAARRADEPIGRLSLQTEAERRQIIAESRGPRLPFAARRLHELFEARAAHAPDAHALVCGGERLTYAQLDARADALARSLRRRGVAPGQGVGILMESSAEAILSILAVLKTGAAYVPLDPSLPAERLRMMAEDAHLSLLLARAQETEEAELGGLTVMRVGAAGGVEHADADAEVADSAAEVEEGARAQSEGDSALPAYAIFTSGSTGRPKAVVCSHAGVVNLLADFERRAPLPEGARCSLWTSLSFDVSVYEIFSALCSGATLMIPPEDVRLSTEKFIDWLSEQEVESGYVPPFMLAELSERLRAGGGPRSLSRMLVGVEPISEQLLAAAASGLPGLRIVNGYGPTEATVCATIYDVPPGEQDGAGNAPIGRAVQNTSAYLLDEELHPVPAGLRGELYLGGAGLALGYLGRPGLTAERFVPDPFSDEPGARLYRTGDLARQRADGELEFIGRRDHQVKLRGYRIELEEIESHLRGHASVSKAAVLVREQETRGAELVAYVEAAEGGLLALGARELSRELRGSLRERLPEYMVPSRVVWLERMPQTATGKTDRRALAALGVGDAGPEDAVGPLEEQRDATPVEELLAGVWGEILGVERVGVEDNFFELGGHSLLGMRMLAKVLELFRVDLPLRTLFEAPTVAALARRVESADALTPQALQLKQGARLEPVPRDVAPPLSYNQEARLFKHWRQSMQSIPNRPFNVRLVFRADGPLDAAALSRAVNEIIRRHEVLRSTFPRMKGVLSNKRLAPVINKLFSMQSVMKRIRRVFGKKGGGRSSAFRQEIVPEARIELPVVDLRALPEAEREEEARRLVREEIKRHFDDSVAPRVRGILIRLGEEQHVLCFVLDHFASDGWSNQIFTWELKTLYAAFSRGEPSPLPELAVQFGDFAHWEREWLQGDVLDKMLSFWKEQLPGVGLIPEVELPFGRPATPGAAYDYRAGIESVTVPPPLFKSLRELCNSRGATMFMLQLAAFKALLHHYTGREQIGVWGALANRSRPETQGLIGWFANLHVLATDLSGDPPFTELLEQVRWRILGAYAHQSIPYSLLFVALLQQFEGYRLPKNMYEVSSINFLYARQTGETQQMGEITLSPFEVRYHALDYGAVTVFVGERPDTLEVEINYSPERFDAADIRRLLAHYSELLENVAAEPRARLSELAARLSGRGGA